MDPRASPSPPPGGEQEGGVYGVDVVDVVDDDTPSPTGGGGDGTDDDDGGRQDGTALSSSRLVRFRNEATVRFRHRESATATATATIGEELPAAAAVGGCGGGSDDDETPPRSPATHRDYFLLGRAVAAKAAAAAKRAAAEAAASRAAVRHPPPPLFRRRQAAFPFRPWLREQQQQVQQVQQKQPLRPPPRVLRLTPLKRRAMAHTLYPRREIPESAEAIAAAKRSKAEEEEEQEGEEPPSKRTKAGVQEEWNPPQATVVAAAAAAGGGIASKNPASGTGTQADSIDLCDSDDDEEEGDEKKNDEEKDEEEDKEKDTEPTNGGTSGAAAKSAAATATAVAATTSAPGGPDPRDGGPSSSSFRLPWERFRAGLVERKKAMLARHRRTGLATSATSIDEKEAEDGRPFPGGGGGSSRGGEGAICFDLSSAQNKKREDVPDNGEATSPAETPPETPVPAAKDDHSGTGPSDEASVAGVGADTDTNGSAVERSSKEAPVEGEKGDVEGMETQEDDVPAGDAVMHDRCFPYGESLGLGDWGSSMFGSRAAPEETGRNPTDTIDKGIASVPISSLAVREPESFAMLSFNQNHLIEFTPFFSQKDHDDTSECDPEAPAAKMLGAQDDANGRVSDPQNPNTCKCVEIVSQSDGTKVASPARCSDPLFFRLAGIHGISVLS